jgi:hypothetical protein
MSVRREEPHSGQDVAAYLRCQLPDGLTVDTHLHDVPRRPRKLLNDVMQRRVHPSLAVRAGDRGEPVKM